MEKPQQNSLPQNKNGGTLIASCALATCFLTLLCTTLTLIFFLLFRPRAPQIHISAMNLTQFSSNNGVANFYFAQYASLRNPNRASFSHYDSSIRLLHGGAQIGFMFIPAGEIAGGQTVFMEASFPVRSFYEFGNGGVVEVESRMEVKGRVRVLMFFVHRVDVDVGCSVGFSSRDGSVVGFRC